jgi:hypothetical protein
VGADDGHAAFLAQAGDHVLDEGEVAVGLGRAAEGVAPEGVALGPLGVAPVFQAEGGIGDDEVEGFQGVFAGGVARVVEGIAALHEGVVDVVEEERHLADGPRVEVFLLAVEGEVAGASALAFEVVDGFEEHTAGAAGGIVDGHTLFGAEDLDHEAHDLLGRVELAALLPGVVGELGDEVFVGVAQDGGGHVGPAHAVFLEVVEQVLQQAVGEALLVGEVHILEDAFEAGVGVFNGAEGDVELGSDIDGDLAHVAPHAVFGDVEAVLAGIQGHGLVAFELRHEGVVFLLPHVAEALVEQQAEDIVLEVAGIDGAT